MSGCWRFTATCPRCGRPLDHVTGSNAHPTLNVESRAIAVCADCKERFLLHLTLRSTTTAAAAEYQTSRLASRGETESHPTGRMAS